MKMVTTFQKVTFLYAYVYRREVASTGQLTTNLITFHS